MVKYYGRARQRIGSVNTNQIGLKMSGCVSKVGRSGVIDRYISRRSQCNQKYCGPVIYHDVYWSWNNERCVPRVPRSQSFNSGVGHKSNPRFNCGGTCAVNLDPDTAVGILKAYFDNDNHNVALASTYEDCIAAGGDTCLDSIIIYSKNTRVYLNLPVHVQNAVDVINGLGFAGPVAIGGISVIHKVAVVNKNDQSKLRLNGFGKVLTFGINTLIAYIKVADPDNCDTGTYTLGLWCETPCKSDGTYISCLKKFITNNNITEIVFRFPLTTGYPVPQSGGVPCAADPDLEKHWTQFTDPTMCDLGGPWFALTGSGTIVDLLKDFKGDWFWLLPAPSQSTSSGHFSLGKNYPESYEYDLSLNYLDLKYTVQLIDWFARKYYIYTSGGKTGLVFESEGMKYPWIPIKMSAVDDRKPAPQCVSDKAGDDCWNCDKVPTTCGPIKYFSGFTKDANEWLVSVATTRGSKVSEFFSWGVTGYVSQYQVGANNLYYDWHNWLTDELSKPPGLSVPVRYYPEWYGLFCQPHHKASAQNGATVQYNKALASDNPGKTLFRTFLNGVSDSMCTVDEGKQGSWLNTPSPPKNQPTSGIRTKKLSPYDDSIQRNIRDYYTWPQSNHSDYYTALISIEPNFFGGQDPTTLGQCDTSGDSSLAAPPPPSPSGSSPVPKTWTMPEIKSFLDCVAQGMTDVKSLMTVKKSTNPNFDKQFEPIKHFMLFQTNYFICNSKGGTN